VKNALAEMKRAGVTIIRSAELLKSQ